MVEKADDPEAVLVVVFGCQLLDNVRERAMPDIVQQPKKRDVLGLISCQETFLDQTLTEKKGLAVNSHGVFKTIMGRARKDNNIRTQLGNTQKPLEKRMMDDRYYVPYIYTLVGRNTDEFLIIPVFHILS